MSVFVRDESFKGFLKQYPVTSIMVFVNALLFFLMSLNGGSTNASTLLQYGAFYKPLVVEGEWYRFLSAMFLHIGFQHFLFNMFSLIVFAAGLEKIIGSVRYTFVYILAGLGGSLLTFLSGTDVLVAGASGAIFGIFGAFLALLLNKRYYLDQGTKQVFLAVLAINLIYTFVGANISVEGHIGGLVAGFIVAFMLTMKK